MSTGSKLATMALISATGLLIGQGCPGTTTPVTEVAASTPSSTNAGNSNNGSSNTGGTTTSSIVDVSIDNYAFTPASVTVQAGQAVRWTNLQFVTHSVRSGNPGDSDAGSLFDSGGLGVGRTFEFTFTTPGTYRYHDTYYSSRATMRDATVIVTSAGN